MQSNAGKTIGTFCEMTLRSRLRSAGQSKHIIRWGAILFCAAVWALIIYSL
jgi:hypothetical protein